MHGLDSRRTKVSFSFPVMVVWPFTGSKTAGTWSWALNYIYCRVQGLEIYLHFKTWVLIKHEVFVIFSSFLPPFMPRTSLQTPHAHPSRLYTDANTFHAQNVLNCRSFSTEVHHVSYERFNMPKHANKEVINLYKYTHTWYMNNWHRRRR